MPPPSCTILGGANGSGKSSLYETLRPAGVFVNADILARHINPQRPETASFAAGRRALRWLADLIAKRENFVFETTLSGRQPLDLMRRALETGYTVRLIFVVLRSADLHVDRVAQRVSQGGHDIARQTILRRYEGALDQLSKALRVAEETIVVDNTSRKPVVLLRVAAGAVVGSHLDLAEPIHARIACAAAAALGLDERTAVSR